MEFYYGDVVRDRETGILAVISEVQHSQNRILYAIHTLPDEEERAWFTSDQLEIITLGPAFHKLRELQGKIPRRIECL